jgi:hypothetical protein
LQRHVFFSFKQFCTEAHHNNKSSIESQVIKAKEVLVRPFKNENVHCRLPTQSNYSCDRQIDNCKTDDWKDESASIRPKLKRIFEQYPYETKPEHSKKTVKSSNLPVKGHLFSLLFLFSNLFFFFHL